jgi:hypothetical protein
MPTAQHPLRRQFLVYSLEVAGIPFYIGIGRAERAFDRERYVRYLMQREERGKSVK